MSEVHRYITGHSKKQNHLVESFLRLERAREAAIEEAVSLCQKGLPFNTDQINLVTKEINELAANGIVPTRQFVSIQMVKEYVEKQN